MSSAKRLPLNAIIKTLGGVGDDYSGWTEAENATDVPHSNASPSPLSYVIEINKGYYVDFINLSSQPETGADMDANYHRVWKCKDGHAWNDSPECRGMPKKDGSCVFFERTQYADPDNYGCLLSDPYGEVWDIAIAFEIGATNSRGALRTGNRTTTDSIYGSSITPEPKFINCYIWDVTLGGGGTNPRAIDFGTAHGSISVNCVIRRSDGLGLVHNNSTKHYHYGTTIGTCATDGLSVLSSGIVNLMNVINTSTQSGEGIANKITCLDAVTPDFVDSANGNFRLLWEDTDARRQGTTPPTERVLTYTAVNSSTTAGTITFPSSVTLVTGQHITVLIGITTTARGTFRVTTGGTGTSFAVTTDIGSNAFANGDIMIVHGAFGFDDDADEHVRTQNWDIGAFQQHWNKDFDGQRGRDQTHDVIGIDVELVKDIDGIVSR